MKQRIILFAILCVMTVTGGWAQAPAEEATYQQGLEAYRDNNYEAAIEAFQSLVDQGYASDELYYNLGNAYYRTNQVGASILNYERAIKLNPANEDAVYNLSLANLRVVDKVKPVPKLMVVEWVESVIFAQSSTGWAWISIILMFAVLGLASVFLFVDQPIVKRIGFFGGIAVAVIALVVGGVSLNRASQEANSGSGIILTPNAYVKSAPGQGEDMLVIHEGLKVEIVDMQPEWVKIRVNDANTQEVVGFVPAESVGQI
ncbi:tetratricopeptide repeat protein [Pontibacter sp. G13]|uniref:tetratricopeptide repeat protein n=1 Tax=Pontibacter sp. G13 TaxID=3074898 RepID=UPI00288A35CE|nr:tetratricopeptide repeat protein [Pontibacter sp. G13]WNJ19902.1 tetratricopeptide repeat protein [Pontibacter sp. G13]